MQTVYAFSGLGADYRTFSKLDLSGCDIVYIEWIKPVNHESFASYVNRLADYHKIPKEGAHVIGVSFGGMCISELAKYYSFSKIVLISSAKTKFELPKAYKFSKLLPIHKWFPGKLFNHPLWIHYWLFGISDQSDKGLMDVIIKDTDANFLKWAVETIVHWDNEIIPPNCLHIHGDQDRIIPINNVEFSVKIKGGGHFMVVNRAVEISYSIRNFLFSKSFDR